MEDPASPQEVKRRMRSVAPLTDEDAEQLFALLQGVHASAKRMADIVPVFPGEVDAKTLSQTVDGDDAAPAAGTSS